MGQHSLVDFSLQIPAVAVFFTVLLGVGVAQSWRSQEGGECRESVTEIRVS